MKTITALIEIMLKVYKIARGIDDRDQTDAERLQHIVDLIAGWKDAC